MSIEPYLERQGYYQGTLFEMGGLMSMDCREYKLPDGRRLWVGAGISSGTTWMTLTERKSGRGQQRYKTSALPLRETEAEAQADLDAYAAAKGLEAEG